MIEQDVFFLDKEDAIEFQNKCVIAIFLDKHSDIEFIKYLDTNTFLGRIEGVESVIYLFDTPKEGSEAGCVFRTRNRKVSKPIHHYRLFSKQFLDEYLKYRSNVYEYIIEHFFIEWKKYFGELFISKEPEEAMSFKYKQCVEKKSDKENVQLGDYFKEFLDGAMVFSNPKTFNDPFDCDCDLPDINSTINLIWNAFNSLKYSGCGSTSVKKEDVEKVLKYGHKRENIRQIICDIIVEGKKDDKVTKSRSIKSETVETIQKIYERMLNQVTNLKECFRVLCTGDKPDDILMWGYYCDGGNGVCCKYDRRDIVNSIIAERRECICVYGKVEYQQDKPMYYYTTEDLTDNVFEYVMRCIFTKYSGWKHENEYRYVLMEKVFNQDYIAINSTIQEYYLGCKVENTSTTSKYLMSKGALTKSLKKTKDKYSLSI